MTTTDNKATTKIDNGPAGKGAAGDASATPATTSNKNEDPAKVETVATQKDQIVESAEAAKKPNDGAPVKPAATADNSPATGGGDHANISAATQDPKNANVVIDNQTAQPKVEGHDDPRTAGTTDYVAGSDAQIEETAIPDDETLAAMDEALGYKVGESQASDTDRENAREAADKIVKMINSMPSDAKDSLTIYGYGGFVVSLGDLRKILRGHPDLIN